jgi:transposase, IS30 family
MGRCNIRYRVSGVAMDFEIREDRSGGGRRLVRERAVYLDLVSRGVSSREACRVVGINPRTGKRWRNGRHHGRAPGGVSGGVSGGGRAVVAGVVRGRYLSEDDRVHIADRRRAGATMRLIADELGRDRSTISRELRRNAHPGSGDYRPHAAHRRAQARRLRPKQAKIAANPHLRRAVQAGLDRRWSPEQIVRRLRRDFPDQPGMHVTHETIYRALYVQGRGELRRELARALRTGRAPAARCAAHGARPSSAPPAWPPRWS